MEEDSISLGPPHTCMSHTHTHANTNACMHHVSMTRKRKMARTSRHPYLILHVRRHAAVSRNVSCAFCCCSQVPFSQCRGSLLSHYPDVMFPLCKGIRYCQVLLVIYCQVICLGEHVTLGCYWYDISITEYIEVLQAAFAPQCMYWMLRTKAAMKSHNTHCNTYEPTRNSSGNICLIMIYSLVVAFGLWNLLLPILFSTITLSGSLWGCVIRLKELGITKMSLQDGSVGKDDCHQVWWHEFDPWDLHRWRR